MRERQRKNERERTIQCDRKRYSGRDRVRDKRKIE